MLSISSVLGCLLRPDIVLFVLLGALAGTLVGALPGLSVTMATALLLIRVLKQTTPLIKLY